jgi:hypothetical protein
VVQVRPTDADCCVCPSRFRTALWLQLRSPMGQDDSPTGARMRSNDSVSAGSRCLLPRPLATDEQQSKI